MQAALWRARASCDKDGAAAALDPTRGSNPGAGRWRRQDASRTSFTKCDRWVRGTRVRISCARGGGAGSLRPRVLGCCVGYRRCQCDFLEGGLAPPQTALHQQHALKEQGSSAVYGLPGIADQPGPPRSAFPAAIAVGAGVTGCSSMRRNWWSRHTFSATVGPQQ
jgi:hypothetical protein